jgi:hypothetical protein
MTNGILHTDDDNILRLLDNATSSSGSDASYVEGPMTKVGNDEFKFPIGKAGRWRRAGISSILSTSTEVTAEYFNTGYEFLTPVTGDLQQVSGTEYWNIDRTGSADGVRIRLFWNNPSNIGNCDNLKIAHYKAGSWVEEVATVVSGSYCNATGSGSIETDDPVTTFSPFTFGDGGGALPIKLVSFTTESHETHVTAKWITSVEINNNYFTVERSTDAVNFYEISRTAGAGNSTEELRYETIDAQPLEGISYYRLKQTDFDAQFSYSDILSVNRLKASQITLFPNPVEGDLNLSLHNVTGEVQLSIFDITGKEVVGKEYAADTESPTRTVNLSLRDVVPPGIYFVRVNSAGSELNQKIIVK